LNIELSTSRSYRSFEFTTLLSDETSRTVDPYNAGERGDFDLPDQAGKQLHLDAAYQIPSSTLYVF